MRLHAAPPPTAAESVTQRWIVQLEAPPLAQAPPTRPEFATMELSQSRIGRLDVNSLAAQQYRSQLVQQQTALFQTMQQILPAAQFQRSYQVVFNGVGVFLPGATDADIARLSRLPGVRAVYPDQEYKQEMFSSLSVINAPALWENPGIGGQANAGAGIKIAVIDDGIRVDNPFFNPEGFTYPEGYPKGEAAYTTPKVIVARAYFRPDVPPLPGSETPAPGPQDSSHGAHVAGIAAGVANTSATFAGVTRTISGVAPRAYLMSYKVFYANESPFGGAFSIELIAALEDAVRDGADVINNSWGGSATTRPEASPIVQTAEAAVDAGVTVVFAAGNEGPDKSTAGGPGYSDKLIAVGSSTKPEVIASGFVDVVAPAGVPEDIVGKPFARAEFGANIRDAIFGPAGYVPVASVSDSALACEPLRSGALSGQIAVIERGTCEFSLKAFYAQEAGAIAAIVYNSETGGETLLGMAAGARADEVRIPAVFVQRSTGLGMLNWYADTGAAARVQIDPRGRVIEQTADVVATSSSRGPSFQGSLKPDVVAPGVNILSAGFAPDAEGVDQHRGFGVVSGTSMAAPHVSGATALLLQVHPDWSPADVKSALMTTANNTAWLDDGRTRPASVLDEGAGRIDLARAVDPGLLLDRPSLSFGNLIPTVGEPVRSSIAVRARNITASTQTYNLTARPADGANFTISVSPAQITVEPQQEVAFSVAIEIPAGAGTGDYGGLVELSGPQGLHLPVWARTLPAERGTKVLLIDNDGSTSLGTRDYSGYYANALMEQGISTTYLDVDALAPAEQTLPDIGELQRHELILWFTGDNFVPSGALPVATPLTPVDQNLLAAYLQSGGSLIVSGQDFVDASDIDPNPEPFYGRSLIYRGYLGGRFVQDDVYGEEERSQRTAVGTGRQAWTNNIRLDLSTLPAGIIPSDATGAGNQTSIDESMLDDSDPRTPDRYTIPIFRAQNTGGGTEGIIGLNVSSEPTLEDPVIDFPYRTIYLGFGLEGVRNDTGTTTRKELLQALLYWVVDRPAVTLENSAAQVTGSNQEMSFSAQAQSNIPASFVRYRWDFGDGSPILETAEATVTHSYAQPGTYQVRVEVTDNWGHRAVTAGSPEAGINPTAGGDPAVGADPGVEMSPATEMNPRATGLAPVTFAETGQTVQGRFLEFWQEHGGVPVFGYPLTAQQETPQVSQVFERTRFEYHPEHTAPYDVLLGHLGVETLQAQGRDWQTFATVEDAPEGCLYFVETRHSLCGAFQEYWQRHGLELDRQEGSSYAESLALFGLPISEPHEERLEDGNVYLVQWFERARFEYHPAEQTVLLGRLAALMNR